MALIESLTLKWHNQPTKMTFIIRIIGILPTTSMISGLDFESVLQQCVFVVRLCERCSAEMHNWLRVLNCFWQNEITVLRRRKTTWTHTEYTGQKGGPGYIKQLCHHMWFLHLTLYAFSTKAKCWRQYFSCIKCYK